MIHEPIQMLERVLAPVGTSPRAVRRLFKTFGDLGGILSADPEKLAQVTGVSEQAAAFLGEIKPISVELAKEAVIGRPVITSWSQLIAYCRTALAHEEREQFRVLFLDRKNRLIAAETLGHGTTNHAPVYPREVIRRAILNNAAAIILVHNHPSGDATPSQADIEMTKTMIDIAKSFEIVVHDHLVIARENTSSFKTLGLI